MVFARIARVGYCTSAERRTGPFDGRAARQLVALAIDRGKVVGQRLVPSGTFSRISPQADVVLGDGHDASDPAFEALKQRLLAEHGVDSVEELPMNFRGVVSEYNEGKVTELLNEFAEARMQTESAQNALLPKHGWVAPILPLMEASRVLSGSDIANHHAFLRKAEETRFEFVQGLNRLHAQKLSLADDLQRVLTLRPNKERD